MSYDPALPADLIEALWREDLDQMVFSGALLQSKDRCVVARYDHREGPLLIKRHVWGGWWRTVRMALALRAPSARRTAALGRELARHGIRTPLPRAHVELRIGPLGYRSYLVTDFVDGPTLYYYVRSARLEPPMLRHLARQVAHIWQQLIELGISHNDLKPENFMIDRSGRVWLIDLEKVRVHRGRTELRERHLEDANRFLHVRTWRPQPEAAEVFRAALRGTSLGQWLAGRPAGSHRLLASGYSADELAGALSVVVWCSKPGGDTPQAARTVDSVRDIADEIRLVGPCASGDGLGVLQTIRPWHGPGSHVAAAVPARPRQSAVATQPWVLLLEENDYVMPELAREIQERMADRPDCDAFRIPRERYVGGPRVRWPKSADAAPIRLFRQERCRLSVGADGIAVLARQDRVGRLTWPIRHYERSGVEPAASVGVRRDAAAVSKAA